MGNYENVTRMETNDFLKDMDQREQRRAWIAEKWKKRVLKKLRGDIKVYTKQERCEEI